MTTTVRISETYDLSTQVDKMGFVAIHTPSMDAIKRQWKGLMENHKFVKLVGCDVGMACASVLPADPLQVGTEAGDIAPQDMFNPILYKAVSNDSFNNLLAMMKNQNMLPDVIGDSSAPDPSATYGSISADNDLNLFSQDQFNMYYGLLANSDGWKKAMPQAGIMMKGLYPIVFSLETTGTPFGMPIRDMAGQAQIGREDVWEISAQTMGATSGNIAVLRGNASRMGAIATYVVGSSKFPETDTVCSENVIPRCYVGAIILPPAKLNRLFYRMKVTWTIEFSGVRSLADLMSPVGLATLGKTTYGTDYVEQSKSMKNKTELVDTTGTDITKVMESIR